MRLGETLNLVRQMGIPWVFNRVGYAVRRKTGWLARRMPMKSWDDYALSTWSGKLSTDEMLEQLRVSAQRFFIHPGLLDQYRPLLESFTAQQLTLEVAQANEARRGFFRVFDGQPLGFGWPPRWHRHPLTGAEWPRKHWSELPEMPQSDVKWLWELAKFRIAYTLVRAYWRSGDAIHAETFWELVESWRVDNPPNQGCHWACGQECAFRVLAWCFGLFGFLDAPPTSPDRLTSLIEMLAAHGDRIEANIGFAVSQKNNHAVNEALALWTLGTLLPSLPAAASWESKGRHHLEREAARQIYDDGAYVQHSFNYHRLVLQSYAWALRLGDLQGKPFSEQLRSRVSKAARTLGSLTDPISGSTPNYGSNDGAMLWHLDSCKYADQRGTLAVALWITEGKRIFHPGPWDESLLWLCGPSALAAPCKPEPQRAIAASVGGYYTICSDDSWAFTRCCVYRDRPAQADMLHVDLWWRGWNLLADPGTFAYAGSPPWNNGLASTSVHNALTFEGRDQMQRGPRFLWFNWARGRVLQHDSQRQDCVQLFTGEHDGYKDGLGITHRRAIVCVDGSCWVIVDDVFGSGEHEACSAWLFPRATVTPLEPTSYCVTTPVGKAFITHRLYSSQHREIPLSLGFVSGAESSTIGWYSPCYGQKEAATSVVARWRGLLPVRQITTIGLGKPASPEQTEAALGALLAGIERDAAAVAKPGAASCIRK